MEPILFYSLGVVTVIALALVVGAVRLQKQVVELQHGSQGLQKQIDNQERYFENRFRLLEESLKELNTSTDLEFNTLYKTIDSRLDKLENKLSTKK